MKKTRLTLLATLIVLAAVASWFARPYGSFAAANSEAQTPPSEAVPITAVAAKVEDVPVDLRGLGTVQAFNTVEIKAQVNGTLIAIPVQEGQEVHQGDIVAQIDPRPYQAALDQATAQRAEDAAQLQSAQLDLQPLSAPREEQFAPVQQVDDQQATVNKLVAAVQADTAAIETAQINLGYCTIRAPINGRVSFLPDRCRQPDPGREPDRHCLDHPGQADLGGLHLARGGACRASSEAMAKGYVAWWLSTQRRQDRSSPTAQLLTPNNTIDTTTGTIQLKATFANDNDALWPGEFVNARLRVDTLHNAVTVPVAAIQHGPDGLFVYTVKPDNTVQEQAVRSPIRTRDRGDRQGVQGGENVVLTGQSRLPPARGSR